MSDKNNIKGFSKLPKQDKIKWLAERYLSNAPQFIEELASFWHPDEDLQRILDGFSENTISNFPMPFGIAPNFVINGNTYAIPMVIEESSVVAAAASAAKFWMTRGGFKAEVLSTIKLGQVHFYWHGDHDLLQTHFADIKTQLLADAQEITANMEKRGGGVIDISLVDFHNEEPGYYQLFCKFETCDSMGANFINSVLEQFGQSLKNYVASHQAFDNAPEVDVIMAILSNFTPECIVRATVQCPIEELAGVAKDVAPQIFADKFYKAVRIAHLDPHRATTHNKGIFNGIDAVVIATGNDFRAIEACGHTYAAQSGQYRSLSHCSIDNGIFKFWIDLPLAVGTVGGLTNLHPFAKRSLELLGQPSAEELMQIIAVTGLAQNFGALRSLTTTGIQQGHMKMHLTNILNHLQATPDELVAATAYFADKTVSFNSARSFLEAHRKA